RRRIVLDVVHLARDGIGSPAAHPLHDRIVRDLQDDYGIEPPTALREDALEAVGLTDVARKTVEDRPRDSGLLGEGLPHETEDDLVRHQLPRVHEPLRLPAQLGAFPDRRAQDVARCDLRNPQPLRQLAPLRSLPRARCSEQYQMHLSTSLCLWNYR